MKHFSKTLAILAVASMALVACNNTQSGKKSETTQPEVAMDVKEAGDVLASLKDADNKPLLSGGQVADQAKILAGKKISKRRFLELFGYTSKMMGQNKLAVFSNNDRNPEALNEALSLADTKINTNELAELTLYFTNLKRENGNKMLFEKSAHKFAKELLAKGRTQETLITLNTRLSELKSSAKSKKVLISKAQALKITIALMQTKDFDAAKTEAAIKGIEAKGDRLAALKAAFNKQIKIEQILIEEAVANTKKSAPKPSDKKVEKAKATGTALPANAITGQAATTGLKFNQ